MSPCKTKLSDFRATKYIVLDVIVINHSSLEYWKLWLLSKKYIKCSLILIFFPLECISTKRTPKLSKSICNSYAGYSYTFPLILLRNVSDSSFNLFSQIWLAIYRSASWGIMASDLSGTSECVYWKVVNYPRWMKHSTAPSWSSSLEEVSYTWVTIFFHVWPPKP